MSDELDLVMVTFERLKRVSPDGVEYWMARELAESLTYTNWRHFDAVISKAQESCTGAGWDASNHFVGTDTLVGIGSGASRSIPDYFLTRLACYLIAMNGDASKTEIAKAQRYFAIQTRRQELADAMTDDELRLEQRRRVSDAYKGLSSTAKRAGVRRYAIFSDAGLKGLYGMGLRNIKGYKGLAATDELFDRAGRTELAANEFHLTQASDRIAREGVSTERAAIDTNRTVGAEVREAIRKIGGTMPEDLPPEESCKKLASKLKKAKKEALMKAMPSPNELPPT